MIWGERGSIPLVATFFAAITLWRSILWYRRIHALAVDWEIVDRGSPLDVTLDAARDWIMGGVGCICGLMALVMLVLS